MDDFIELFDESDLKELNLEPIKQKEVEKIVQSLHSVPKKRQPRLFTSDTVYVPRETARLLIRMMLNS